MPAETINNTLFTNEEVTLAENEVDRIPADKPTIGVLPVHDYYNKILGMPKRIFNGPLNNVDFNLTPAWFLSTWPDVMSKFEGFRATLCMRAVVTGSRYACGLYKMTFVPYGFFKNDNHPTDYVQLPGNYLSLPHEDTVELRVPYCSISPYIHPDAMGTQSLGFGWLSLKTLVAVPSSTKYVFPRVTVYTWLEDVELTIPVCQNIVIQSGEEVVVSQDVVVEIPPQQTITPRSNDNNTVYTFPVSSQALSLAIALDSMYKTLSQCITFQPSNIQLQSGLEREVKAADKPLTDMLLAAGRVATKVGRRWPLLSSYTTTLSWAARTGARFASAFGWSKPSLTSPATNVRVVNGNELQNCDGATHRHNLGLTGDNLVAAATNVAGIDYDELSLDSFLSNPTLTNYIVWSDATAIDTNLAVIQLSPSAMFYQNSETPRKVLSYDRRIAVSPTFGPAVFNGAIFYAAQCFYYWRGGFKFKLRLPHTDGHRGQLTFMYHSVNPYTDASTGLATPVCPSLTNFVGTPIKQFNLGSSEVFEFEVPYTSLHPYLPTSMGFGYLQIMVTEPLTISPNVHNVLSGVIEVTAMPGFEFMGPRRPSMWPTTPANVVVQSGSEIAICDNCTDLAVQSVGERILSLKQLMTVVRFNLVSLASNTLTYSPFIVRDSVPALPAGTRVGDSTVFDMINYFSPCFARFSGNMDVHVSAPGVVSAQLIIPGYSVAGVSSRTRMLARRFYEGLSSFMVPLYSPFRLRMATPVVESLMPQVAIHVGTRDQEAVGFKNWYLARTLSDNGNMHMFLGVPPLIPATDGRDFLAS